MNLSMNDSEGMTSSIADEYSNWIYFKESSYGHSLSSHTDLHVFVSLIPDILHDLVCVKSMIVFSSCCFA